MARTLSLSYTRPKPMDPRSMHQRTDSESTDQGKSSGSVKSGQSSNLAGIPESLTFDNIINGGTCPPMTVRDFMSYLVYVEHSAENLQFYLWYHDYAKRFSTAATADLKLAPEWTEAMEEDTIAKIRKVRVEKMRPEPEVAEIFKGTDFEKPGRDGHRAADSSSGNPFSTPPRTPRGEEDLASRTSNAALSTKSSNYKCQAAEAFGHAGAKQPFTIQPFREEINRVIATYIMDGAPRQLNLSSLEQKAAVQALSYTTHPTALCSLFKTVDASLRCQAHPNFVRWSICNGNPARVLFARCLGVGLIVAAFVVAIVLTLSSAGRGYRAIAAVGWILGISTLVAAYKGMCVVLHGMHHRHVRPWELFVDPEEQELAEKGKMSFESFGSTNSYEDEPWVVKYQKRNVVRKVFDREVWVQEPALRQVQDTIFVQAMLAAILMGGVLTAVFVTVPGGNFF